ncbi:alpha/beta hydrolase [Nonomuraea sp. NPDC050404]|uniref:alpha/beta hydrolase n=1 Tax=Nonomuraea sp. NPDC050404 TaxID=3155783 RepID=UPI0033E2CA86
MSWKAWRRTGVLMSALGMAVCAAAPSAVAKAAELDWRACAGAPQLECATVRVPLDYDRPKGEKITLALSRIKATDSAARKGSLVVNRGGPGYSTVEYLQGIVAGTLPSPVDAEVRKAYDIVGVDTRGSGRSTPAVRCFETPAEAAAFAKDVPDAPVTAADRQRRAKADADFARLCRERSGGLLDHISSVSMARDLDAVRAAMGEKRLNYLGQSYGTYLGMVYANLFGDKTGKFVFDSVIDPGKRDSGHPLSTASSRNRTDISTKRTLAEFFRLCEEAGDRCSFGNGDPAAAFDDILTALRKGSIQLTNPAGKKVALTYSYVVSWTGSWLYQPMFWNQLGGAPFLKAVGAAIKDPAGSEATALAQEIELLQQQGIGVAGYGSPIEAAFHAVTCPETDNPANARALAKVAAERDKVAAPFGSLRAYETSACSFWQSKSDERHRGPWTAKTNEPVLILNSRHDPATPVWSAERVQRLLPGSRLLVNEGWGHVTTQQSTCAIKAISAYLLEDKLPERGAECRPDTVPFAASSG